ncbi:copper resistance CopC family protein [Streptomyces sp. NRRL S-813]|uniref:copper resistance CopC/CopD family protein n=1 Tax=Streptomyces sp. NRRL S-813 TaxID=1463919 RepID=UPI0004C14949|nr:copper resistance CopC family protein [Streptomyces sp. NRRL S-813]
MRRIITMLCLVLCLAAASAGPASAHTGVRSSDPAAGEVLPGLPAQVALTFRQPVTAGENVVRVFDDHMRRVDLGGHPGDRPDPVVRTALPGGLHSGTYTVAWQVTSADGHPVAGTFRFSIQRTSRVAGTVPPLGGSGSAWAGRLLGVSRAAGYAGLALGPGVLLVVLWLWPAGLRDRRSRNLVWAGLGLLAAGTLAVLAVHAVWAAGRPLSDAWSGSGNHQHAALADHAYAVRFYALLALGAATVLATLVPQQATSGTSARRARAAALVATVAAMVLWGTWPVAGHSVDGRYAFLALAADFAHLAAMTVWLGGLALAAAVLARPRAVIALALVLPRFSRLAFACVSVLVVTGTFQAWREVGTVGTLFDTRFGRLLLLKSAGVAVVVALGGVARRWLRRHTTTVTKPTPVPAIPVGERGAKVTLLAPAAPVLPDTAHVRALRRGLVAELLVGFLVLSVTAALVVTNPPA